MNTTRVIIVEDEPLFRQLIHTQLSADPEIEIVGEADNGEDAVELAKTLEPEVVLMDIEMGEGMTGIEGDFADVDVAVGVHTDAVGRYELAWLLAFVWMPE